LKLIIIIFYKVRLISVVHYVGEDSREVNDVGAPHVNCGCEQSFTLVQGAKRELLPCNFGTLSAISNSNYVESQVQRQHITCAPSKRNWDLKSIMA